MTRPKGVMIYLSADDLEALGHAHDHLYTLHEGAAVSVPELSSALNGVHRLIDKASKAHQSKSKRQMIAKALKLADKILAER